MIVRNCSLSMIEIRCLDKHVIYFIGPNQTADLSVFDLKPETKSFDLVEAMVDATAKEYSHDDDPHRLYNERDIEKAFKRGYHKALKSIPS